MFVHIEAVGTETAPDTIYPVRCIRYQIQSTGGRIRSSKDRIFLGGPRLEELTIQVHQEGSSSASLID